MILGSAVDLRFISNSASVCYLRVLDLHRAALSNVTHWVSIVSHTHSSAYSCTCAVHHNKVRACVLPYRQAVGPGNSCSLK